MQKVNLNDGRVGPGLDLGWTINMYNELSHSILSSIGLDYDVFAG